MIQVQTILKVIDNTGAKTAKCIKILPSNGRKYASIGDYILVCIKSIRWKEGATQVKKGQIYKALVVHTKKNKCTHGVRYNFEDNEIILINGQNGVIGTRIFGSVTRDLKIHKKIISQAKHIL